MSSEAQEEQEWSEDDEILIVRKKRRGHKELIEGLNLTAMMDMMTIILVFLIKQYASAPDNIQVNEVMMPPKSAADATIVPTISIFISKTDIMVEQKSVLKVENWKIVGSDPTKATQPLFEALEMRRRITEKIAEKGGTPFDGSVMLVADENTPYELMASVVQVAGKAGFSSYRMIVRLKK